MDRMHFRDFTILGQNTQMLSHILRTRLRVPIVFLLATICNNQLLLAQATPTASRTVDLQAGATFNLAAPDYTSSLLRGFGFYGTADFKYHFGVEAAFHQLNGPDSTHGIYERTFEVGPRYKLHYGPFEPYGKLMIGRGVFNFPPPPNATQSGPAANLAFNMWAAGFGVDYTLRPSLNLRVDYEFQRWGSFPPNGLSPQMFGIGIAYHFR